MTLCSLDSQLQIVISNNSTPKRGATRVLRALAVGPLATHPREEGEGTKGGGVIHVLHPFRGLVDRAPNLSTGLYSKEKD